MESTKLLENDERVDEIDDFAASLDNELSNWMRSQGVDA